VLGVALGLVFVAALPVSALSHQLNAAGSGWSASSSPRSRPRNPIGWCMLGSALFLVLSALGSSYSILDYRMRHDSLDRPLPRRRAAVGTLALARRAPSRRRGRLARRRIRDRGRGDRGPSHRRHAVRRPSSVRSTGDSTGRATTPMRS
jgi:hypothetical protein